MASRWRIRHKLIFGMALAAAIMGLLLAGAVKGLASYRSTMRTIDSKLLELKTAEQLTDKIKILGSPSTSMDAQVTELLAKVRTAQEGLADYARSLETTLLLRRDPEQGFDEKELIRYLDGKLTALDKSLRDAAVQPRILRPGESYDLTQKGTAIRDSIDKLIATSLDLVSKINGDLKRCIDRGRYDYKISLAIVLSTVALAVLLMAALVRFFYSWMVYPIRDLESGVGRVARGDFEHKIAVNSGDEIEDLGQAFNDMTGRLREMYRDLAQQVNERSRQLVRSERLAGVGFLAAGVAHEINNPLAGIAFCSEALKRRLMDLFAPANFNAQASGQVGQEKEIFAKYLNMIEEEAFRCKNITQKLLAFSRGGEKHREPTALGDLVQSVIDMVQHHETCRGKELVFQPQEAIQVWVNGPEIKQVFLNLVMNALDSMEEGGRLVITQSVKDGLAELSFKDTGCGMTSEVLDNIFEPFFTRSRSGKGTGLGLSISHQIITQHGGDIEASSAGAGQGSMFIVRLPLQPPEKTSETPESPDPVVAFSKMTSARRKKAA